MHQEVKEFLEFFQQKPDFGKPNPNNLNMEGLIMEEKLETGPAQFFNSEDIDFGSFAS